MRICVVTSLAVNAEPRAPRHAIAAKLAAPEAEVLFLELVPKGDSASLSPFVRGEKLMSVAFPSRRHGTAQLAARKIAVRASEALFDRFGMVVPALFGDRVVGLQKVLQEASADLYICHNIETLLPTARAAEKNGARIIFDCMEYYSDMGEGQRPVQRRAATKVEADILKRCDLVLASSDELADALVETYRIARPLAVYNVPPIVRDLPPKSRGGGLNLYWRNGTIGLSQRGLEDALVALTMLPSDVRLFVQGRIRPEDAEAVQRRSDELGVSSRVKILPPYQPAQAVAHAAPYDVGLCLERPGPRNHELTVSNKMFDYHMAGLAILSSDMPSLSAILERSGGGEVFRAGDSADLAKKILALYEDPARLRYYSEKARQFALNTGNLDVEMARLQTAFQRIVLEIGADRS